MYNRQQGNRGFGGGFIVPFVLGGITGSLISNNNNRYYPYPYPYPYPYYVQGYGTPYYYY